MTTITQIRKILLLLGSDNIELEAAKEEVAAQNITASELEALRVYLLKKLNTRRARALDAYMQIFIDSPRLCGYAIYNLSVVVMRPSALFIGKSPKSDYFVGKKLRFVRTMSKEKRWALYKLFISAYDKRQCITDRIDADKIFIQHIITVLK